MSRSSWTHCICGECWIYRSLKDQTEQFAKIYEGRYVVALPVRLKEAESEPCCYCGRQTRFGAFVREHPATATLQCSVEAQ
jgi:hypothetical protein